VGGERSETEKRMPLLEANQSAKRGRAQRSLLATMDELGRTFGKPGGGTRSQLSRHISYLPISTSPRRYIPLFCVLTRSVILVKARRPQGEGEGEGSSGKSFMKGGRYGDADGIVTVEVSPRAWNLELGTAPLIEKRQIRILGFSHQTRRSSS